jgi:hypothetical protein
MLPFSGLKPQGFLESITAGLKACSTRHAEKVWTCTRRVEQVGNGGQCSVW